MASASAGTIEALTKVPPACVNTRGLAQESEAPMHDQLTFPSGLCECGCGHAAPKTNSERGWVKGHPIRFIHGHQNRRRQVPYREEDRGYSTPCWVWLGAKQPGPWDYGVMYHGGRTCRAHRVYYERAKGPIPDGLELDHLCRVPACVNSDHLEPVTPAENTRRGNVARLSEEDVLFVRASSLPKRTLARQMGVSRGAIEGIRRGWTWQDVA